MESEEVKETKSPQDKLDLEYRQILRIIKPFITTINNNIHLAQYRIWLEKLSETKENEKLLRNQYLMELARQIQSKDLAIPFTLNPPKGPLLSLGSPQWNLERTQNNTSQPNSINPEFVDKQKLCQQWTDENKGSISEKRSQWPYHSNIPRPRRQRNEPDQQMREAQRCIKRSATSLKKISLMNEIDEQTREDVDTASKTPIRPIRPVLQPQSNTSLKDLEPRRRHPTYPQNPLLSVILEDNIDFDDESSWCGMSDTSNLSLAVLGSGDVDPINKDQKKKGHFEKKINTLMVEINGLTKKNDKMGEKCEHSINMVQQQLGLQGFPAYTIEETKIDVDQTNSSEKCGSFLMTDWKKIIESLQLRLSETQQQNKELNAVISTLHKKIKEMDANKEQAKQNFKKQLEEQYKNEIECLNSNHSRLLKELEETHEEKLKEMEEKAHSMRIETEKGIEKKTKEVESNYQNQLKEKENEINRLENIIQKECMRLINEITILRNQIDEASHTNTSNDERILFLQKCITKMDRLFQKSEREYSKQIEKLKQDLDNRDKAVQIQLQTQKAEVISKCCAEKQAELDEVVENLECKYTKLLEKQQNQLCKIKEADEITMHTLRVILDQHNIPY